MTTKSIRVLVVDDSAVLRARICDILAMEPGLEVVGTACDGLDALRKLEVLQPDLMTLDVQMPRMDGLATVDAVLSKRSIPIIMVSSLTHRAASTTLDALERGAMDYIAKPDGSGASVEFAEQLVHKIRVMANVDVQRVLQFRRAKAARMAASRSAALSNPADTESTEKYPTQCIALGVSTGGPPALASMFQDLQAPLPPLVIVQHMPANFTGPFAARLDSLSKLSVKEAQHGDRLRANHAYIAPGGKHLRLKRQGDYTVVSITDGEPVSSHKPSIDLMMQDAAAIFGLGCLGVLMTGMGSDGVAGCRAIREAGGYVLGQDEASSDVYGMNKAAFVQGQVDSQFAVEYLPQILAQQCRRIGVAQQASGAVGVR
ncbi:protein-glutamate methylesterase/protein-glutamine glutaminase [Lignipirellula cremea]|uniref:Protein-glutamate methylesterase/protein-glutamine glutaminase n=1 Tax=Lignipirellula cremea TaxID=2528010 RepID=A0A518DUB0_9BACT|nr:chemotaxis response regulator protein-glutamate methylesterase [Lignipirellula cremea]QDU95432.1 Chemotaxis response regulator protein-glutamate methylesterase [Lignipirellula cremea]